MNKSCQDCTYFENRACTDKVAFSAMLHGPSTVSCQEFEPLYKTDQKVSNNIFCTDCSHFENILGWTICGKAYKPGIACPAFKRKS